MAERSGVYWQTQSHVSANKFDISRLHCEEIVHASSIPSGFPDVYVNGEDLTITVDPVKNSMWVRDDASGHHRHAYSVARGALKDHRGVMMVQHLLGDHPGGDTTFVPTTQHLDDSLKFSARCVMNSTRGDVHVGRMPRKGELPSISQMQYDGALLDKPDWLIEAEMYDALKRPERFFDCSGVCR